VVSESILNMNKNASSPARLDETIYIQSQTAVHDGQGGVVREWSDKKKIFAEVKARTGTEKFQSGEVRVVGSYTFTIRNNRQIIQEEDRIFWNNELYNVVFVERQSKRDLYIKIHAEIGGNTSK